MKGFNDSQTGRFGKGNKAAIGRGSARRATFVRITRENVSEEEWKNIISKAKRDALGVAVVLNPQGERVLIDDPNSDGSTRAKARQFLGEYLMGKAPQPVEIDEKEGIDSLLDQLGEPELDALIAAGGPQGIIGTSEAGEGTEEGEE